MTAHIENLHFHIEERAQAVSNRPWSDFPESAYSPEQWRAACLIDTGNGAPDSKDRYALPVKEPDGTLNVNGVHAAAGRLSQVGTSPEKKAAAARALVRLYGQIKGDPPDDIKKLAGLQTNAAQALASASTAKPEQRNAHGVIVEERSAAIADMSFSERVIKVIAVPYEQPTVVPYRGDVWQEVFERSAFQGFDPLNPRQRVVPVGAVLRAPAYDHDGGQLVGKVGATYPDRSDGLVLDLNIARTAAGDDTLELANNGMLYPSVGFGVRVPSSDQQLDRRNKMRRVKKAFLDHVSMVPTPAYQGAEVLQVRADGTMANGGEVPPLPATPALDEILSDPVFSWATERLGR